MGELPPISRQDSEPLYLQIADRLRRAIVDGTYPPSSVLPPEIELASILQVSRPTVRHALDVLIQEQLIERVPGRGTYVRNARPTPSRTRTGNIALIGPEMRDSFLVNIVTGAERVASRRGYHLMLCNAGTQASLEEKCLRDLWEGKKTDGFVLYSVDLPHPQRTVREFVQAGVPIVFIDRFFEELNAPFVVSDNVQGGYLATKHLIDLGHRRIGFISRPNLYISTAAHRLQGYRDALAEAGLEYDLGLIFQGLLPSMDEIRAPRLAQYDRAAIREFLDSRTRPSAIVTLNDLIAIQAVTACRELDLRIPEDVAIVSFDDDHSASLMTPTLTTVRQQAYEMGARAAASLLDMVSGEPVQQQVVLPVELIVRQSCGAGS